MSVQHRRRAAGLAALLAICTIGGASAQEQPASVSETTSVYGDESAFAEISPLDDAALGEALNLDGLATTLKPKDINARGAGADPTWTRNDAINGTSSYSVKKALQTPWDANVGADFNVVTPAVPSPGSGSAWANVNVPYLATLGVRAEPTNDYSKFGTSLERSVPLGSNYAVSLQGSVAVTELYASLGATPATVPGAPAKILDTDNSVKFSIRSTGTALSAGALTSSIDPSTHTRLTAEQKVYGPLNVTGSIYDPGRTTSSTSIGAGLKFDW